MWYFTKIADWFEGKRDQTNSILDQWVEDSNYNEGVMIVAATTQAFSTFGAGFVDLLRLGDGIREGSLRGLGTDALRFVAIFPVGKAANVLKSTKGISLAKVIVDTGGPNCFWVASAKAFAQIGQKYKGRLFASVEDVAKALNMPMNNLWVIPNLATGLSYLQRLGAKIGAVRAVSTLQDIKQMVPRDGSVVLIAVHVLDDGGKLAAGHAIYAYRNAVGQVRFMDRTVGQAFPTGTRGIYKSIDEIAEEYMGVSALVPYEAAVLHNIFVKSVAYETPKLVIPVLGVIATKDDQ